ncbi:MAG TPA: RNA polymerase sigma factor [Pyrinomonadaceae bacterium]|jgi:RNA polymerase sigma-70 factor (ECF subfamily)|nr:RNA polymerase sigma factor [Pyrinomonadaceae bacterium]
MTPLELPDELLAIEAILGNLEAFEQLVVRYRPAVVRLARTIVGSEYAEDVAQESLLLAFKALPSIEEPRKFAPWLSAITRHRALRFSKHETAHANKRVPLDDALLEKIEALAKPSAYKPLTDQALADKERDEAMLKAVDGLPDDYSLPLKLHFLDDMPLKRISAFMGVPLSTVKWRIHQGKKLLRAKLENTNY